MRFVRFGSVAAIGVLTAIVAVAPAAGASTTFYVNGKTGDDKNACTSPAAPCKTIMAAVKKAEEDPEGEADTIELAAGVYEGIVQLRNPAAGGITINGAGSGPGGTEIEGPEKASEPTVQLEVLGGAVALSNLSVVNDKTEDSHEGIAIGTRATLTGVTVTMEQPTTASGILLAEVGALTMKGGGVTMEAGTEGPALASELVPVTIEDASILLASGAKGGGIETEAAPVSVSGTVVNVASSASEDPALVMQLGSGTLTGDSIVDSAGNQSAVEALAPASLSLQGLSVSMTNPANSRPAVVQSLGTATYDHLTVGGSWTGPAFASEAGNITIADSAIATAAASTNPALEYFQGAEVPGLVVQRSVIHAAAAAPASLLGLNADVMLDSSEVLGGKSAIKDEDFGGKVKTVTVAGSTIDAGSLGVADAGSFGVTLVAGKSNTIVSAAIEGSIVLEPQVSLLAPEGRSASITCSNSDVPSQVQAAAGSEGSIQCASGSEGNTHTEAAALFSSPITDYQPSPGSSAIDSVPAAAIALPFGLTPSSTDLAGNPRVLDGNGDCLAAQDRGAIELQGHAAACPPAPAPGGAASTAAAKPVPGVISGLTISPSAFYAAQSGATISTAKRKARRKYGATISYRDSQSATTTFTVLRVSGGRRHGKRCRRPSRSNRHGKRCTILTALGSFTHKDVAATATKLHFSGRLRGHRLSRGSYRLRAIPHDAAGNGAAAAGRFAIK